MRNILFYLFLLYPLLVTGQDYKSISCELEVCFDLDQSIRDSLIVTIEKYGFNSQKYLEALQFMDKQDSINQKKIFRIMDDHGWLTPPMVSKKASKAFFYIIQHLKIGEQIAYKDSVENAFIKRAISPQEYAIFTDRVLIGQQKYQLYGTQKGFDQNGNLHFYPIIEYQHINERRALINLPLFNKDDIDTYKYQYNGPSNKILIFQIRNSDGTVGVSNVGIFDNKNKLGMTNEAGYLEISVSRKQMQRSLIIKLIKGKDSMIYPVPQMNNIDFVSIYLNTKFKQ